MDNKETIAKNTTGYIKNEDFIELDKSILLLVYNFLKDHDIPNAYSFLYTIDDLAELKKNGVQYPTCETYASIVDFDNNEIIVSA